jgi:hypothetical protein
MPSLKELFKTKPLPTQDGKTGLEAYDIRNSKDIPITSTNSILNGTVFPIVQKTLRGSSTLTARTKETLIEEELVGLRAIGGLASPVIYGSDLIRLKTRTTNMKTDMVNASNGGDGDGGIIGNFINRVKDTALEISSKLGIAFPETLIPTRISINKKFKEALEPDTMRVLAEIKKDGTGNIVGKFLAKNAKGTPNQIGRQVIGAGIDAIKGEIRKKLFGSPKVGAQNLAKKDPTGVQYDRIARYSNTVFAEGEIDVRNDLSTLLKERNGRMIKIIKGGDTAEKLIAGANTNLVNPPAIKLPNRNPFTPTNELIKDVELKGRDGLALARKKGQRELSKPENIKSDFQYIDTIRYSDTVDETIDDIKLRRDLSSKLDTILNAKLREGVLGGEISGSLNVKNQINPLPVVAKETKYSKDRTFNVKTLTQKIIGGELNYGDDYTSKRGDFVNSKPPYSGSQLILSDGSSLDEYDLIPLKFTSIGGRSVNFTAIIDGVSETLSPTWDSAKFIGSPFNYYTYSGIERSVSFNLKLFSLNPAEHVIMWEKIDFLTSLVYPIGYDSTSTYVVPPFLTFTMGNLYKNKFCFIESLSYTVDDNGGWETGTPINDLRTRDIYGKKVDFNEYKLPKVINAAIGLKFVESRGNTVGSKYGFGKKLFSTDSVKNIK